MEPLQTISDRLTSIAWDVIELVPQMVVTVVILAFTWFVARRGMP